MEIRKNILLKYIEQAAIEQIATEYQQQGYEIKPTFQDFGADLIVQKGEEIIVVEIKAGRWDDKRRQAVKELRNRAVHELGAKFNLVFVNLPQEPEIEVEGLEGLFFELLPEQLVDEFSKLATHFWPNEISDISFESISVQKDGIDIAGNGIITLGLQYGSDSDYKHDDGLRFIEAYPFHFYLALDHNLEIKEVYEIEVDLPDNDDE